MALQCGSVQGLDGWLKSRCCVAAAGPWGALQSAVSLGAFSYVCDLLGSRAETRSAHAACIDQVTSAAPLLLTHARSVKLVSAYVASTQAN